jgi:hypothetical protein
VLGGDGGVGGVGEGAGAILGSLPGGMSVQRVEEQLALRNVHTTYVQHPPLLLN